MKETFTEKEFTELLELENFTLGVTRSPKWTLYTRYTIAFEASAELNIRQIPALSRL